MHQVQLNDRLYREAERRAREAGFATVDEFLADLLESDLTGQQENSDPSPKNGVSTEEPGVPGGVENEIDNFDHLFTPERLAHIDRAAADIEAGRFYTTEQAEAELARRRAEWLRKSPR